MRPRFRVTSVAIALMSAVLIAAPVAAASPWTVYKQSGVSAYAFEDACTDEDGTTTCEGRSIDVFEGTTQEPGMPKRTGEQVCYSQYREVMDHDAGELIEYRAVFGCRLGGASVTTDGLTSTTLAPTIVELTAIACDASTCTESPGGSISVQGAWTGTGPTSSQRGKFAFDDGSCVQRNADKGTSRQATFVGSIAALDARIGTGSFTFKTNCPF